MPLVEMHIYLYPHQKQWIKTLSERTKLSQAKLLRILTCQFMLITDGIRGEELQETLSKRNGMSREKLDELDRVKNLLRKKRKDQKERIQYFLENWDTPVGKKSLSELIRFLVECDMLDKESSAKLGEKKLLLLKEEHRLLEEENQLLNLKLKYLVENKELRENKIHQMIVENKQGA